MVQDLKMHNQYSNCQITRFIIALFPGVLTIQFRSLRFCILQMIENWMVGVRAGLSHGNCWYLWCDENTEQNEVRFLFMNAYSIVGILYKDKILNCKSQNHKIINVWCHHMYDVTVCMMSPYVRCHHIFSFSSSSSSGLTKLPKMEGKLLGGNFNSQPPMRLMPISEVTTSWCTQIANWFERR